MGLIITTSLHDSELNISEPTSKIYIEVNKKFFSTTYELIQFSEITAKILDIYDPYERVWISASESLRVILEELTDNITLRFVSMKIGNDRLYFTPSSWNKIRQYGFLSGAMINILITHGFTTEGKVEIFPRRDIKA